jgi:hypothetical protein
MSYAVARWKNSATFLFGLPDAQRTYNHARSDYPNEFVTTGASHRPAAPLMGGRTYFRFLPGGIG